MYQGSGHYREEGPARRGRPLRSEGERLRDRMRTAALLNELLARSRSNNPNRFARWFDEEMRRRHPGRAWETESSGKWRKNFSGHAALTKEQLSFLSELFLDAWQLYLAGPGRLWDALWGNADELWTVCRMIVAEYAEQPRDQYEVFAGPELTFDESIYNFECSLISTERCAGNDAGSDYALTIGDLAEAIAFWRLHQRLNAIAKIDGVGAYRCVQACLSAPAVRQRLHELGVLDDLLGYVVSVEASRIHREPSYRESIALACFGQRDQWFDASDYALDPFQLCSVGKRMDALRIA